MTLPTPDELRAMPARTVGLVMLREIVSRAGTRALERQRFIAEIADELIGSKRTGLRYLHEALATDPPLGRALAEGWDWCVSERLLARDPLTRDGTAAYDAWFVTRLGAEVARRSDGASVLDARRRLGVELHHRLADDLAPLVAVGAFEEAAFRALRASKCAFGNSPATCVVIVAGNCKELP